MFNVIELGGERETDKETGTTTDRQRQIQRERQIYTLSSSGAVPYRYKLFQ